MSGTTLQSPPKVPGGPTSSLPAPSLALAGTLFYTEDTEELFRCSDDGSAWVLIAQALPERGVVVGKGGALATAADTADFPVVVPFDMTLRRMKAICATAPTTAMTVQLRRSSSSITPSYSDISGFLLTFISTQHSAIVDPLNADVNEGDVLSFSLGSASGSNMLVEIVGVAR